MSKRVLIAAMLVAAMAGGGAFATAQSPQGPGGRGGPGPGGPGPRRPGGPMADFGLRGIELTDAQREQVRSIMDAHKTEFDATSTKLRDAHRLFAEATIEAATVDESAVRAAATAVAAAMADEAILRAKVRAEVEATLTPEQQEQLKQRREDMQKRQPRARRGPGR